MGLELFEFNTNKTYPADTSSFTVASKGFPYICLDPCNSTFLFEKPEEREGIDVAGGIDFSSKLRFADLPVCFRLIFPVLWFYRIFGNQIL
jgi:hypothetical protein